MSAEVITENRYYPIEQQRTLPTARLAPGACQTSSTGPSSAAPAGLKHQPIHDLESFFWVLCYLCLFINGPNIRRERETWIRSDIDAEEREEREAVVLQVNQLFVVAAPHVIAARKARVMLDVDVFEKVVANELSPYCKPLFNEVFRLHNTLRVAYMKKQDLHPCNDVYDSFLEILSVADKEPSVRDWNPSNPIYAQQELSEEDRRIREMIRWDPLVRLDQEQPKKRKRPDVDDSESIASTSAGPSTALGPSLAPIPTSSSTTNPRRSGRLSGDKGTSSKRNKGEERTMASITADSSTTSPKSTPRKPRRSARTSSDKSASTQKSSPARLSDKGTPNKKQRKK